MKVTNIQDYIYFYFEFCAGGHALNDSRLELIICKKLIKYGIMPTVMFGLNGRNFVKYTIFNNVCNIDPFDFSIVNAIRGVIDETV